MLARYERFIRIAACATSPTPCKRARAGFTLVLEAYVLALGVRGISRSHGRDYEAITAASIDTGAAFEAGIKANFPNAEITFDKFHVVKLANEAAMGCGARRLGTTFRLSSCAVFT